MQDYNGAIALIYAAVFSKPEIVRLLLENKADKNIKDNMGNTALQHALLQDNKETIILLK